MAATPRKPKYRFLDRTALEDIPAEPVPLEGVFQLTKPRFEPLSGHHVPTLDDGERPTAVGLAAMEWWGNVNESDWRTCPTDFVRSIEAVSATNDNVVRIRQATKRPTPVWERNHAGLFSAVTIDVLVPSVGPATVQPRENTAYGRLLRNTYEQSLIHEIGDDLDVIGESADHFNNIRAVQLEVIEPAAYRGDRRDFIDSLALEGIREPLRGFTYLLSTTNGQSGHFVETNDGYTRVAIAQQLISILLDGLPTDLSRLSWENGDGTMTVRGWTAEKILELHEAVNFIDAPFDVWPGSETTAGISRWIADASLHAEAVMRLMTARMTIGIKVRPHTRHSTFDVVYADMARFHVKGHQPAPWNRNDDEAFKARTIVSNLARDGFVDNQERDVFLGSVEVPWEDDPTRVPYRNRLVATTDTMVRFVVEDPRDRDRYPAVRRTLKAMQVPNSPTQAAAAAASLAAQVAGLLNSGEVGGFTAMIRRSFANAQVRYLAGHDGDWTAQITDDVDLIIARARNELVSVLGSNRHANYLGPNMRALAVLAMAGHGMNPRLTEYRKSDDPNSEGSVRTVRWPSSMTASGRGRRAGAGGADAHTVVFNMARSPEGIDQLETIVRAVTDHTEPVLPLDPISGAALLEDVLRATWSKPPDQHGTRYNADGGASTRDGGQFTVDSEAVETLAEFPALSEDGEWHKQVTVFRDELRGMASKAELLSGVPAGPDHLGVDPDDWDPDDDSLPRMLDVVGVDDDTANSSNDDVDAIRKFFVDGAIAWLRNRAVS